MERRIIRAISRLTGACASVSATRACTGGSSRADEALALDVPGAVTIDNTQFALDLAVAGGGLAYLPEPCVMPSVARGALQIVLADWAPMGPGFHVYYPGRRQLPAGLRLLIELIREIKPLGL